MLNEQDFHDKLLFSILKIYLHLSTTFVGQLSKDIMDTGDSNVVRRIVWANPWVF